MSKLTKLCRAKFDRLAAINAMPASDRPAQAKRMLIAYETDGRTKRERKPTEKLGSMWNPTGTKRFAR